MLNRIRISTTLFLILILCGVLQVGSNGLSFWAFRDGYQNLQEVETSNQSAPHWHKRVPCCCRQARR